MYIATCYEMYSLIYQVLHQGDLHCTQYTCNTKIWDAKAKIIMVRRELKRPRIDGRQHRIGKVGKRIDTLVVTKFTNNQKLKTGMRCCPIQIALFFKILVI